MTLKFSEPEVRAWVLAAGARLRQVPRFVVIAATVIAIGAVVAAFAFQRPEPEASEAEASPGHVVLNADQRRAAGVVVAPLMRTTLPPVIRAPGEVRTNDYITKVVGPRITATVVARHAKLGDTVKAGQVLVTLYSRDMAEAQSGFVLAERDLARYRRLNASAAIAQKDLDSALSRRQELYGRLLSFGLTAPQIAALSRQGLANSATGQFDLVAPIAGTVTKDEFREGDVIVVEQESKPLFEITDPKDVWVEARVAQSMARSIGGSEARVIAGDHIKAARIVQVGSTMDEATRTVLVRLAVDNSDLLLRPGQFVDVELSGSAEPVLTVPTNAVLRDLSGNWVVYVEDKDGAFEPRRVRLRYASGERSAIDGLAEKTRVVTAGAFFVHSEAQKSSFADED
jgi:RND family efflux transporter MFP subunit